MFEGDLNLNHLNPRNQVTNTWNNSIACKNNSIAGFVEESQSSIRVENQENRSSSSKSSSRSNTTSSSSAPEGGQRPRKSYSDLTGLFSLSSFSGGSDPANSRFGFREKCAALLPLLFQTDKDLGKCSDHLQFVTTKDLVEQKNRKMSRSIDRSYRQTVPTTNSRRRARSSPRTSNVSSETEAIVQSLRRSIEGRRTRRGTNRGQERENLIENNDGDDFEEIGPGSRRSASDLAMETMEYKFQQTRKKRNLVKKLARANSSGKVDDTNKANGEIKKNIGLDGNGNRIIIAPDSPIESSTEMTPDLSLSIITKLSSPPPVSRPELLSSSEAEAISGGLLASSVPPSSPTLSPIPIVAPKSKEAGKGNKFKKSRFGQERRSLNSDSEELEDPDSGYDISDAKSALTADPDAMSDRYTVHVGQIGGVGGGLAPQSRLSPTSSRALSRGSFASSARPLSSEYSESVWGSQELLETSTDDNKSYKKDKMGGSSDFLEMDMFADAEDDNEMVDENRNRTTKKGYVTYVKCDETEDDENVSFKMKDGILQKPRETVFKDFKSLDPGTGETSAEEFAAIRSSPDLNMNRITLHVDGAKDRKHIEEGSCDYNANDTYDNMDVRSRKEEVIRDAHLKGKLDSTVTTPAAAGTHSSSNPSKGRQGGRRVKHDRRSTSDPAYSLYEAERRSDSFRVKRGSIAIPYSGITISRGAASGFLRPNVSSLRARYEGRDLDVSTPEDELEPLEFIKERKIKRTNERKDDHRNDVPFPISRKTQTKPEVCQIKLISRACQAKAKSSPKSDRSVNTEIDMPLMTALLQKLLARKISTSCQTDIIKDDAISKKDASVGTEKFSRERFSALPMTRSRFAQTDSSWLRSKNTGVSTEDDPEFNKKFKTRVMNETIQKMSRDAQTEPQIKHDASVEAQLYSEDESFNTVLDARKENSRIYSDFKQSGFTSGTNSTGTYSIEEDKNSVISKGRSENLYDPSNFSLSSYEDDLPYKGVSEEEVSNPVVESMSYMERYQPKEEFERALSSPDSKIENKPVKHVKIDTKYEPPLATPYKFVDYEAKMLLSDEEQESEGTRNHSTRALRKELIPCVIAKPPPPRSQNIVKLENKPASIIKRFPKDLRTESRVIVEITQPKTKEISEVTSFTEVQNDGKLARRTTVTTTKKVPVYQSQPQLRHSSGMNKITSDPIITSPPSTKATTSPILKPKTRVNIQSVAPSECSTRPASAMDLSVPSLLSPSTRSIRSPSSILTPSFSESNIEPQRTSRVNLTDPLHIVIVEPSQSSSSESSSKLKNTSQNTHYVPGALCLPEKIQNANLYRFNNQAVNWEEISSSTICNEMTTDPFKNEEGKAQNPKSVSMTSETSIERNGKNSQIKTRSRASRKYDNNVHEPDITSETTVNDIPPDLNPKNLKEKLRPHNGLKMATSADTLLSSLDDAEALSSTRPLNKKKERKGPLFNQERVSSSPSLNLQPERNATRHEDNPEEGRSQARGLSTSLAREDKNERETEMTYKYVSPHREMASLPRERSVKQRKPLLETTLSDGEPITVDLSDPSSSLTPSPSLIKKRKIGDKTNSRKGAKMMHLDPELNASIAQKAKNKAFCSADQINSVPAFESRMNGNLSSRTTNPINSDNHFHNDYPVVDSVVKRDAEEFKNEAAESSKAPGTEIVTRITRTTHPEKIERTASGELIKHMKHSRTVLEQEVESGDGVFDLNGCKITSQIIMDTPNMTINYNNGELNGPGKPYTGVIIKELNENETLKSSTEDLDEKSSCENINGSNNDSGDMVTETKFQRYKTNSKGKRGRQETTWEYSMECTCVNGLNTQIRTNVKHKRVYLPLTQYESSV